MSEQPHYVRGHINCASCNKSFGKEVLLDGGTVTCGRCGTVCRLPVKRTPYGVETFNQKVCKDNRSKSFALGCVISSLVLLVVGGVLAQLTLQLDGGLALILGLGAFFFWAIFARAVAEGLPE